MGAMFDITTPTQAAFAGYALVMIVIGIWVYRRVTTLSDFAIGGRTLNAPTAALSAQAGDTSGWQLLGLSGAIYAQGIGATWIAIGLVIGTYLTWFLVASRLRTQSERAGDAVSLSAYLEERFEDRTHLLRLVSALAIIVFGTVYVVGGLVAGGLLVETVFGVESRTAITAAVAVIVLYTFLGGFLAVSFTDVIQAIVVFLVLLVLPLFAVGVMGGFGALKDSLNGQTPALLDLGREVTFADGAWTAGVPISAIAIVSALAWGLGYFGQPPILARFMGIASADRVPAARRIALLWVVVALAGVALAGLVAIGSLNAPVENPETVFFALTGHLLDPWAAGLVAALLLAAIMSLTDSQLLVSSVALTEDVYRAFLHRNASQRTLVWIGRGTVIVVAVAAYVLALRGGAVLDLVAYAWAGFGAAFGPVVLLSLYWSRMTWLGALAGILAGAATVGVWPNVAVLADTGIYEIIPGWLAATLAAVLFGVIGRRPSRGLPAE